MKIKEQFLNLGKQPLSNAFVSNVDEKEYMFNLGVQYNKFNHLVSLTEVPAGNLIFNETYPYRPSVSKTMVKHFTDIANRIKSDLKPNRLLEIGSIDGVFLNHFNINGYSNVGVGVEPCSNFAKELQEKGYIIYNKFWTQQTANNIIDYHGKMDVVYSANCMCHIPDIVSAFMAVNSVLKEDGVFIFEDPSLLSLLKNKDFTNFYDEHAHIFSILALKNLLQLSGFQIISIEHLPHIHGGSNRIFAKKRGIEDASVEFNLREEKNEGLNSINRFRLLANDTKYNIKNLKNILNDLKASGEKIVAYGATSKSTVLYNFMGIGPEIIDFVIDITPEKENKFMPGVHIPIKNTQIPNDVNYVLLTAWNFKNEIFEKEREYRNRGGKFILYIPEVEVI